MKLFTILKNVVRGIVGYAAAILIPIGRRTIIAGNPNCEWQHCDTLRPDLGDIIQFRRVGYKHVGIYVGEGYVVHKTGNVRNNGSSFKLSSSNSKAVIKKRKLRDVAKGDRCRVWNYENLARWLNWRKVPANKIVQKATNLVGKEEPYDVITNNCETFACRLRYNETFSPQGFVHNALEYVLAA